MPSFSIKKAHEAQSRLSEKVIHKDMLDNEIHLIAGVDTAYSKDLSIGAVAVLDYSSLKVLESRTATYRTSLPYIPTLLSFREIPPTILSIGKLQMKPDVFLVDAHGLAHPYRCGFASHLGVVMGKPTIGVAKERLFGEMENAGIRKDVALLKHEDEVIGAVLTTRSRKPLYVSVGHMVSLDTAIKIVQHCTLHTRIPKPILKAHQIATAEKQKITNTVKVDN